MIFGRKFKLHTDHKPLLAIFGKKSGIAVHQANRLQRWAVQLLAYDFEISFISTNSFGYADVLSRLIDTQQSNNEEYVIAAIKFEDEIKQVLCENFDKLPITHKMVMYETQKDPILKQIYYFIENKWPGTTPNVDLKPYFNRKDDFSIVNNVIMLGSRIVIPAIYRKRVLKQIHHGHPGIERSKIIARSYVYWPNIDGDITTLVQNCGNCAAVAKMPTKTLLQQWPKPTEPWQRLHIDYAGPIEGEYFLVIVDALSKWPEIVATKTITTHQTIQILKDVFARFGLPQIIVSDNATQFKSAQFEEFLAQNGIKHLCSSPYYPMSNGQAERFVDTFKRMLAKQKGEGNIHENLNTFLQSYRSTANPNTPDKKSPAEIIFGRKMRITLDLLKPTMEIENIPSIHNNKVYEQFNRRHGARPRVFEENDTVYARVYKSNNSFCWSPGKIIEQVGSVMYNVFLNNGRLIRSHVNQLRKRYNGDDTADEKVWCDALDVYENSDSQKDVPGTSSTTSDNSECSSTTTRRLPSTAPTNFSDTAANSIPRRSQRQRRPVNRFSPS